jgi:hypothetical protein
MSVPCVCVVFLSALFLLNSNFYSLMIYDFRIFVCVSDSVQEKTMRHVTGLLNCNWN